MNILIIIIALVLIVSIYDFATSKSWQQVTSSSRNDIVFGERNKNYGAYQIRKDYDRNLIFILLGVIATIGLSYGSYLFFKSRTIEEIPMPVSEEVIIPLIFPIVDDITPPPPVDRQQSNSARTEQFISPTVTDRPVDNTTPIQERLTNVQIGIETTEGSETSFTTPTGNGQGTGTGTGDETGGEGTAIDPFPDVDALFPGGISAMMNYLGKNIKYPEIAVRAGIEGKTFIRFVVEKDGSIGNVNIQNGVPNCPECDKEAIRVIKMMPKWTPGKSAGKVVRSYYNMPITFKLN